MAYDRLLQSVALIGSRRLVRVERLSRRRRFVAMGVDVDGDLAVTSFARRGVGCTWHDVHVLARRSGTWTMLGGSSTSGAGTDGGSAALLADRPRVLTDWSATTGHPVPTGRALVLEGTGGVHDSRGGADRWPWSGRWVSCTHLLANASATSLTVAGRVLPVPWHGRVVVVWSGRHGPRVVAHDQDGRALDAVALAAVR